ncbi:MAG TPA: SAV_6107 family HEPN domain-containing protein [Pseudonocardiaceae bacterium]
MSAPARKFCQTDPTSHATAAAGASAGSSADPTGEPAMSRDERSPAPRGQTPSVACYRGRRAPRPFRVGPERPRPPAAALALLEQAQQGLLHAEGLPTPAERYASAHQSALRGAAAVLALRGQPHRGRRKPTSAWVLLAKAAPELREWAAFFAEGAKTRHAVQAGITRGVSAEAADDLVRRTGQFLDLVESVVHGARP